VPNRDDVRRLKEMATRPELLDYFFAQLKSPAWIPLLRAEDLISEPPDPVETADGVMFPGWSFSEYLVRVAAQSPRVVGKELRKYISTGNPRVWWNIVDALAEMPSGYSRDFIEPVTRWIHHPYHLGIETSAAKLARHLIASGDRLGSLALIRSFVQLVRPEDWPEDQPWVVLDEWDYGEKLPGLAAELAAFSPEVIDALVAELVLFLESTRPTADGEPHDLSFIWRAAIEDHEQNSDRTREAKLVEAIRDAAMAVVASSTSPDQAESVVQSMLENRWPVVRRIGLYLLAETHGLSELTEAVLADPALFRQEHLRHEMYRLTSRRLGELSMAARERFVAAVEVVGAEYELESEENGADRRKWFVRRWLGAAPDALPGTARVQYDELNSTLPTEAHPDLPSYMETWWGSKSPIEDERAADLDAEELMSYLREWSPTEDVGNVPKVEGLARTLSSEVKRRPEAFAPLALQFADLRPAYTEAFLQGLDGALKQELAFPWEPVLPLCEAVALTDRAEGESRGEDIPTAWRGMRITVIRLIETGLGDHPGQFLRVHGAQVQRLIGALSEDADPTGPDEAKFGSPNMDLVTYSMNTVRGVAVHTAFWYLDWDRRAGTEGWSIESRAPAIGHLLDRRLDRAVESSASVRAAIGWWLRYLIAWDPGWVKGRLPALLGNLDQPDEIAAWEAYLMQGRGRPEEHALLGDAFARYAQYLVTLETAPSDRIAMSEPVPRFIDLLVLPWVHGGVPRAQLPLEAVFGSRRTWLVSEAVEASGRLIHGEPELKDELAAAFRDLWQFIKDATKSMPTEDRKQALAPFGWWVDSALGGTWLLQELLALLEDGVGVDASLVLEPLANFSESEPVLALRALELVGRAAARDWVLRAHEDDVRVVLQSALSSGDGLVVAKATSLVHQLGREGLGRLGSLISRGSAAPPAGAPPPAES
jgi:hypothetical protein